MGKKHAHEEHENHERWVISFADMMTLLFALFVVLYAMKEDAVREARKSIAFHLNFEGLSKTYRDGIFDTGDVGGETYQGELILSQVRGAMKKFVERQAKEFKKEGGRSLEIREEDAGFYYRLPLDELYPSEDARDIREERAAWLLETVAGSLPYGKILRVRIEVYPGTAYVTGEGRQVSRERLCFDRLIWLMRRLTIETALSDEQVQIEFRHFRPNETFARGRSWSQSGRMTLLFAEKWRDDALPAADEPGEGR